MRNILILPLLVFVAACSDQYDVREVTQPTSAIHYGLQQDERDDISVEIVRLNGECVVDLYSYESRKFRVRTSRPLREDEYFWLGTSGPFITYVKFWPEVKPLEFPRSVGEVEVTGGEPGIANFSVVVMTKPDAKIVASANVMTRVLPVPEEDAVAARPGDTLYELASIYLNDPEKWSDVVEKNPFLRERGRVFKRSGQMIAIIHPGEKINGLARLGVKVSR